MTVRFSAFAFVLVFCFFSGKWVFAQTLPPEGVYIIFDASGSMWGKLSDNTLKIETAKKVLEEFVGQDFSGKELALRAYGHRREKDCTDSELLVPFGSPEAVSAEFLRQVKTINPKGRTPISYSFREALKDFGDRAGDIILISDGIETCDEDPCALMREWKGKNINIRVHVVGLGLEEQARLAMECIAEAAGTEYHNAESASELSGELTEIHTTSGTNGVWLIGKTSEGKELTIKGILRQTGRENIVIKSYHRNPVPAGKYKLEVGVETRNGSLYKPVLAEVTIPEKQDKTLSFTIEEPPLIWANFRDGALKEKGALIYAWQNNREVFSFRPQDTVYVEAGTYEFRTQPNPENKLSLTATLLPDEKRELLFALTHTVKVVITIVAAESGLLFRNNYELWQNGEKKYDVHRANGALVIPGVYDVHLPLALTPYAEKNVEINATDAIQNIKVEVPCGHVTVIYQKPDGSRDKDDRCWISLPDGKAQTFHNSGEKYALTPGKYRLTGWAQKGNYAPVNFEIKVGETKEVILRGN
ncbi:MAG: hypothetical protein SF052_26000 [Bacteroidia bacterium]|nr:hypothetical protein [Bacteroidia bacterium]